VEYDGQLSINLQHSFDQVKEPQFFDRGTVNIQSIRTGAVTLQQASLSVEDKHKLKVSNVHFICCLTCFYFLNHKLEVEPQNLWMVFAC
jgi:hypothetical protein